jgi:hypothetical protein
VIANLEPGLVADTLVNLFGAGGTVVVAHEVARSDPMGPVSQRIAFALRFVAVLFVTRTLAWCSDFLLADALADALASATPLLSLIVAEGLMRRHAPRWLKIVLLAGPVVVFSAKLLPFLPPLTPIMLLLAIVAGGFAAIAVLLWRRDVASLNSAENATIQRVLIALTLLAPLVVTDFRSIWPGVPVRLGALGALVLLYVGLGAGTFHGSVAGRLLNMAMFVAIAALFAFAYAGTGHAQGGIDQLIRAAAASTAGLLFAGIFSESQGARFERTRNSTPLAGSLNAEDFLHRLALHPLLSGSQMLPATTLGQVDNPSLRTLLAAHRTLRRAEAPWGRLETDDGVERARSLMAAFDATHLALITETPLRIMAVSLPATATDARAESEIDLMRVIGELVYMKAAQP